METSKVVKVSGKRVNIDENDQLLESCRWD
jgi:hypothetical protein